MKVTISATAIITVNVDTDNKEQAESLAFVKAAETPLAKLVEDGSVELEFDGALLSDVEED
jgi:predicted protein tyrosine phosphatase